MSIGSRSSSCSSQLPSVGLTPRVRAISILFLDVFLQHLATHDSAIHIAIGVDAHALGAAVVVRCRFHIFDERRHHTSLRASDANAFLQTRLIGPPGFGIGDVNRVVFGDVDPARPTELFPLLEVPAVLIENLDAVVHAIAGEDASLGIERDSVRLMKLAWTAALVSPGLDEFSVFRKLDDAVVAGLAMPV